MVKSNLSSLSVVIDEIEERFLSGNGIWINSLDYSKWSCLPMRLEEINSKILLLSRLSESPAVIKALSETLKLAKRRRSTREIMA